MEVMLSGYQADVLNRAIDIFKNRKVSSPTGFNTLVDDAYVLQKALAVWVSENTPISGNSASATGLKTAATLAFNKAINDNGSSATSQSNTSGGSNINTRYSTTTQTAAVGVNNVSFLAG
ncbi:hypothetical protein N9216_02105 [Pseudomonadales bacterium]|nr:hypothetical protein [Pseudomonadales bacterium]